MAGEPIATRAPLHELYFRQHGQRLIDAKQRQLARDPREIAPTELLQAKCEVVDYLDAPARVLDAPAPVLVGQAFVPRSSARRVLQRSFLLDRRRGEASRQGSEPRWQGSELARARLCASPARQKAVPASLFARRARHRGLHRKALILAGEAQSLARKLAKLVLAAVFQLDRSAEPCAQGFLPCGEAFVACTVKLRALRPKLRAFHPKLGALHVERTLSFPTILSFYCPACRVQSAVHSELEQFLSNLRNRADSVRLVSAQAFCTARFRIGALVFDDVNKKLMALVEEELPVKCSSAIDKIKRQIGRWLLAAAAMTRRLKPLIPESPANLQKFVAGRSNPRIPQPNVSKLLIPCSPVPWSTFPRMKPFR